MFIAPLDRAVSQRIAVRMKCTEIGFHASCHGRHSNGGAEPFGDYSR